MTAFSLERNFFEARTRKYWNLSLRIIFYKRSNEWSSQKFVQKNRWKISSSIPHNITHASKKVWNGDKKEVNRLIGAITSVKEYVYHSRVFIREQRIDERIRE